MRFLLYNMQEQENQSINWLPGQRFLQNKSLPLYRINQSTE